MAAARSRGETMAKPRPDAYVGLLGLSLLALVVAIVFAYLNWVQIKEKPKAVPTSPPGGGARMPAPAPSPGPGVAPGQQPVPGAAAPGATPPGAQPQPGGAPAVPPGGNTPPPQKK